MSQITPFTVDVPEAKLSSLKAKLEAAEFPDELQDSAWERGSPLADVKRLAKYWKEGYDWRREEAKINELPNYRTSIQVEGFDPINVHFVHQQSKVESAIPLLFVHGWPGNFLEVVKLLPLLGAGDGKKTPAFHIVAPSLPNYAFSDGVSKRGFGLAQYAECLNKLMLKLGYTEYVHQGGDWGAIIGRAMAKLYPQHLKAQHLNLIFPVRPPNFLQAPMANLEYRFSRSIPVDARSEWFQKEGGGYKLEQGTKPQTLGYGLADSPVGLLAWIYEKLHDWTDDYAWTDDEILTWVSLYWFSVAGPAANIRIYYEASHPGPSGSRFVHRDLVCTEYISGVPLGWSRFPKELRVPHKTFAHSLGPIVHFSDNERGGHFAATEQPEVIVNDITQMLQKGGPCYGVVRGHSGYESSTKAKL